MFRNIALVVLAFAAGGAWSMTAAASPQRCRVSGAEFLPADSGGAAAICAAIDKAAAAHGTSADFTVEIEVRSAHALRAVVTAAGGRKLPEQSLTVADRTLSKSSFERFAVSLVAALHGGNK